MKELDYIYKKFSIDGSGNMPIVIPNFGRYELAGLFAELGYNIGVEVGVKAGDYSEILCKANSSVHLYSVDPWEVSDNWPDHRGQELYDKYEAVARNRLAQYNVTILKMPSEEAVLQFDDGSIDFVYIDGNHDEWHCMHDLVEWTKKVRPGGIISGHDYVHWKRPKGIHVITTVKRYVRANNIRPWFVLGRKEMPPGEIRDEVRSFMWVKKNA